jgi:hypothetical protein
MNYKKEVSESCEKVLKKTPLYYMKFTKLKSLYESYDENNCLPMQEYFDSLKFEKVFTTLLLEVYNVSEKKLKHVFPSKNSIIKGILLFLTHPYNSDVSLEKVNFLEVVLNTTKDPDDDAKYLSGKFSFLIVNIIYFFCNIIIYCVFSLALLQVFEKFSVKDIDQVFVQKAKVREIALSNLQEFYAKKFEIINPRLKSAEPIVECCLPYIFEPIKYLVQDQQDEQSVIISQLELDEIKNRIVYLFDPYVFIEVFLTMKIKDY